MDMQNACAEILDEVDGALGCIVIDMQTGLTVAAKSRPGRTMHSSTVNLVSVISTNMFCGKLIKQFEQALDRPQAPSPGFVREVQMTTESTNQFMAAIPNWNWGLLVLVTDKTVSLGLGWMAVHRGIARLGEAPRPRRTAQPQEASPQLGLEDSAPPHPAPSAADEAPPRPAMVGDTWGRYGAQSPPAAPSPAQRRSDAPAPYRGEAQPPSRVQPSQEASPLETTDTRYYRGTKVEEGQAARPTAEAAQAPPRIKAPITAKAPRAPAAEAAPKAASKEEAKAPAPKDRGPSKAASLGPRMNLFASRQRKGGRK